MRNGLILEHDLSVPGAHLRPGGLAALEASRRWTAARWTLTGDLRAYPVLPDDGPEDLLLLATLRNEFAVEPLRRWLPGLGVGAFLDGQAFLGKGPAAGVPGLHLLLGLSLSWTGEARSTARLR